MALPQKGDHAETNAEKDERQHAQPYALPTVARRDGDGGGRLGSHNLVLQPPRNDEDGSATSSNLKLLRNHFF